jgi:peptidoglycan/LPS O-acetylase OafA/YrhL
VRRFTIRHSSANLPHRSDIQGLRGIAVLMVVAYHAGLPLPGGFVGVDVFFVISGFVITSMLRREYVKTGSIDFRRFYTRRARRLLPALAVVTIVTLAAVFVFQPPLGPQQRAASTSAAASLFFANFAIHRDGAGYFDTNSALNPFLHMWSLSVEEQFYLVFPLFLLGMWHISQKRAHGLRLGFLAVGVMSAISLAACIALTRRSADMMSLAFYASPTRVWEFGAGALVALAANRLHALPRWGASLAAVSGIALIGLAALKISSSHAFPGHLAIIPVAGCAMAIVGGTICQNWASRTLSLRPLTFLGDISYGWYLWHWPAVVFAAQLAGGSRRSLVLASTLALLPAWLSLRFIESPVRHNASLTGRRVIGLAVACICVPAFLGFGVVYGAERGWNRSENVTLAASRDDNTAGTDRHCIGTHTATLEQLERCDWPVANSRGWILLAGDSHADSLSDGLILAGHDLGYDVRQSTGSKCSFSESAPKETSWVSNCGDLYAWTMRMATSTPKPSAVVISHYTQSRVNTFSSTSANSAEEWASGLRSTMQEINDAGIPVLLVRDVPVIGTSPEPCKYGSVIAMQCSVSRSEATQLGARGHAVETRAIEGTERVTLLDVSSLFCDSRQCDAIADDQVLYRDRAHLTATGSRLTAPALRQALAAMLPSA